MRSHYTTGRMHHNHDIFSRFKLRENAGAKVINVVLKFSIGWNCAVVARKVLIYDHEVTTLELFFEAARNVLRHGKRHDREE